MFRGELLSIHRTSRGSEPMELLGQASLVAGVGIEGDRYATRTGTYSARHHVDRQVTLIEVETLEALRRDRGIELTAAEHRRNLTTRGVPLGHLVGAYFRVGPCVLYGGRLNVPCKHLEALTGKAVLRPLLNRSGLNARIVVGGALRAGDVIEPVDRTALPPELVAANELVPVEPAPNV
ncbi:MAG: MOSC domain-containing protein [Acidimicrobiia bacterium]